jgi:hypothetical protein
MNTSPTREWREVTLTSAKERCEREGQLRSQERSAMSEDNVEQSSDAGGQDTRQPRFTVRIPQGGDSQANEGPIRSVWIEDDSVEDEAESAEAERRRRKGHRNKRRRGGGQGRWKRPGAFLADMQVVSDRSLDEGRSGGPISLDEREEGMRGRRNVEA